MTLLQNSKYIKKPWKLEMGQVWIEKQGGEIKAKQTKTQKEQNKMTDSRADLSVVK